ncbi:MAG: N-acetylneuraminate lyase [Roseburia sp.]|nr:N-acetylneuraminate lyase [Roseburia sp.]
MKNNEKFKGIFTALLTPFTEEGKVDVTAIEQLVEYNIRKGISGFYVGGSTGEVFLLRPEERRIVYEICAMAAKGKCTLIAHIGDLSTEKAIEYAKLCEQLGYDAVSSVTPFYYKYSKEELVKYYLDIADAVDLPVLMYCIPALSGVAVGFDVFDRLLSDSRFLGVKFTGNDFFTFERLRKKYPDKILYNGYDEMFLCGMAMGADGAIGSTYNLMAEKFIAMRQLCEEGKYAQAREIQHEANEIIADLVENGNVNGALKYALTDLVGINMGICRKPLTDMPENWKMKFDRKYAGKFEKYYTCV